MSKDPDIRPNSTSSATGTMPSAGPNLRKSNISTANPNIDLAKSRPNTPSLSHPSISKYAKIQPAIAIKPKPLGVTSHVSPPFIPKYETGGPQNPTAPKNNDEALINTSKKWVLPPRPRPGRKPTSSSLGTLSPTPEKVATKKKARTTKKQSDVEPVGSFAKEQMSHQLLPTVSQSLYMAKTISADTNASQNGLNSPAAPKANISRSAEVEEARYVSGKAPYTRNLIPATKATRDLQATYLARLKEQELIRSYIDVLSDQIKQLKFVQNGVITFDVLNDTSIKPVKTPLSSPELFENIHNIHDLDKFLSCLIAQLNVLHSVTRKPELAPTGAINSPSDSPLIQQLNYYLELRAKRLSRGRSQGSQQLKLPQKRDSYAAEGQTGFTPSLLRPLKMDYIEPLQDVVVDIINNGESVINAGANEKGKVDEPPAEMPPGLLNILSQEAEQKGTEEKKRNKPSCGFCSNGTPCLCYDTGV